MQRHIKKVDKLEKKNCQILSDIYAAGKLYNLSIYFGLCAERATSMLWKPFNMTVHHALVSENAFKAVKKVGDSNTLEELVNKVWFDIQLHFGCRGNKGNRQLKPTSFTIKREENGLKYATPVYKESQWPTGET